MRRQARFSSLSSELRDEVGLVARCSSIKKSAAKYLKDKPMSCCIGYFNEVNNRADNLSEKNKILRAFIFESRKACYGCPAINDVETHILRFDEQYTLPIQLSARFVMGLAYSNLFDAVSSAYFGTTEAAGLLETLGTMRCLEKIPDCDLFGKMNILDTSMCKLSILLQRRIVIFHGDTLNEIRPKHKEYCLDTKGSKWHKPVVLIQNKNTFVAMHWKADCINLDKIYLWSDCVNTKRATTSKITEVTKYASDIFFACQECECHPCEHEKTEWSVAAAELKHVIETLSTTSPTSENYSKREEIPEKLANCFHTAEVPSDGECGFYAVSYSLTGTIGLARKLRRLAYVEYLLDKTIKKSLNITREEDLENLQLKLKTTGWMDENILYILAKALSRVIVVYKLCLRCKAHPIGTKYSPEYSKREPIYLYLNNYHFWPLVPMP